MNYIPEDKILEIKEKCSIVEIISDYVSLKKVGINYKGLCPFHIEKTPSFMVNEEKKVFHCFGCGASGNVFNFLMLYDHLSFPDAVREVAKRVGISLHQGENRTSIKEKVEIFDELYQINEFASDYFQKILIHSQEGKTGRDYLIKRGIDSETSYQFKLGFAPKCWDGLYRYLLSKDIPVEKMVKLGLIIFNEDRNSYYDRFRNRLMFPITDFKGRIIGFGGRAVEGDEPKYLNSPDSPIYHKGHHLYGLSQNLDTIKKEDQALIVEGYFDLITLYQYGIKNVVAILGTALTPYQVRLIKKYTKNLVVIFDPDDSGKKAAFRSLLIFLDEQISPQFVNLPKGFDPDSFVRNDKGETLKAILKNPQFLLDIFIEQLFNSGDPYSVKGQLTIIEEALPVLTRIKNTIERDLYIQKIAQRIGVREYIIYQRMKSFDQEKRTDTVLEASDFGESRKVEKMLIRLMLFYPSLISQIQKEEILNDLPNNSWKRLANILIEKFIDNRGVDPTLLMNEIVEDEMRELLSECLFDEEPLEKPLDLLRSCINKIRLHKIGRELRQLNVMISKAKEEGDEVILNLLQYKQELIKKRRDLMQQSI